MRKRERERKLLFFLKFLIVALLSKTQKTTLTPLLPLLRLLLKTKRPPSPPPHNSSAGKEIIEWTPFSTLRDHRNAVFYIRAANSPVFKKVDLNNLDFGKLGKSGIRREPLSTPEKSWWEDSKF